ncbi:hypothetical protein MMC14_008712 [Varicellaria rhodocarpa]|nr:hypothetical protein [Varicellaria rhodocarpa]
MILIVALSNIKLNWIAGVKGEDVPEKVLPPPASRANIKIGNIGSWRAHLHAIASIVQQNLSSVLILEDDADWDVRIKPQLRDFALSTHALTQPLTADLSTYADPTFPSPKDTKIPSDISFDRLPSTIAPLH